jgi:GT2 family glycosyltransferase
LSAAEATGRPPPPIGVFVVGMHRSGTSAATRVVNLLGVPTCRQEDLFSDARGNAKGHWESRSLIGFNDRLLGRLGGAWWCPPPLEPGWASELAWLPLDEGRRVFRAAHPTAQWVWKDPRNCITLPFWRAALDELPVAILVLRNPLAIVRSLRRRNRFGPRLVLALWERYMHTALRGLEGLPVLVARYDDLVDDPSGWCRSAAAFLSVHGVRLAGPPDTRAIARFVDDGLRHSRAGRAELASHPDVSASQLELYDRLERLVGPVDRLRPAELPPAGKRSTRLLSRFAAAHGLAAAGTAAHGRAQPSVSVVVISRNEGVGLRRTVDDLLASVSSNGEIIVVDDDSTDGSVQAVEQQPVTVLRTRRRLGVARARNFGARRATGEVLIFADAHVKAAGPWLRPLVAALLQPRVGAVNPAIRVLGADHHVEGLTFSGPELNVDWLPSNGSAPHHVPFLIGCFLAMRRAVFEEVGGFDDGMVGYGAEDLDLCLRLWRKGYECLVVPESRIAHRFGQGRSEEVDDVGFIHNVLRLATVHLDTDRLVLAVASLRRHHAFPAAMARLMAGDALLRRKAVADASTYGDGWFLERFGIGVFEHQ